MSVRVKRMVLAVLVASLAAGAVAWGFILRPRLLVLRQVANHAACQAEEGRIRDYWQRFGVFPTTLEVAGTGEPLDAWGHRFHYESRGSSFILVSYGKDGQPDGGDYWRLREAGDHPRGWNICGHFNEDEVMSDKGWHRICGK